MKKRRTKVLLSLLGGVMSACCALGFSACASGESSGEVQNPDSEFKTAYALYVTYAEANGQTPSSYEEWLATIKGEKGDNGANGKSAYEIWLDNGNTGTEDDFLNWLKGEKNDGGDESGTVGLRFQRIFGKDEYSVAGLGMASELDVVIPDTYNGLPVTEIKASAFYLESDLRSVTIPDGVTSIGEKAFYGCTDLTEIVFSDSLTSIMDNAFYCCYSLTEIVIPDGVTSIGDKAFYGCLDLTEVVIPDSVTSIGEKAFENCFNLNCNEYEDAKYLGNSQNSYFALIEVKDLINEHVIHPDTKIIASKVYENNKSLMEITIPDSVTTVGTRAFAFCENLTNVLIDNGVTSIEDDTFFCCYNLTGIAIPDGVTTIGENAFYCCYSLTGIVIPASVTTVGHLAFEGCSSLTSVYYQGTASDWEKIRFGSAGEKLTSVTRYYYSESEPTEEGNYWHYDENGKIVVW